MPAVSDASEEPRGPGDATPVAPIPTASTAELVRQRIDRNRGLTAALVGLAVTLGLLAVVHVPYVSYAPGPTQDVLAGSASGQRISVTGVPTYPTTGQLRLVTVSVTAAGRHLNALAALRTWLDPDDALLPRDVIYPKGQPAATAQEQSKVEMTDSQQSAVAAALTAAKVPYTLVPVVTTLTQGGPAEGGSLPVGAQIVTVDNHVIRDANAIAPLVRARPIGSAITIGYLSGGRRGTATITSAATPGKPSVPRIGIELGLSVQSRAKVAVHIGDDIGGPSGGMVFALAIYDRLTPGALLGGTNIAGTGTIDNAGQVGAIGGVREKVLAARRDGATVFLVPAANCAEAVRANVSGVRLVRAETLSGAITALTALRTGSGNVPACGAS